MPCEIGNGHARCNCHRHYSVLRTATCLVASHDDPGLHVEKRNKEEGSCGAGDQLAMLRNSRSRRSVEQGGWIARVAAGGKLGSDATSTRGRTGSPYELCYKHQSGSAAMEHFRRHSHSHHQRPGEEQHRLGCVALCSHEDLTSLFKLRTESCCNAAMQGATQRASCCWLMFFFFVFLLLAV